MSRRSLSEVPPKGRSTRGPSPARGGPHPREIALMSAASLSGASSTPAHRQFEAALPAILATARFAFRRRRPQDRDEAVAEVRAAAWSAWHGLVSRGQDPVAVGVCGIANNAVRSVLNGRRIANTHCGRGAMDVYHPPARKLS